MLSQPLTILNIGSFSSRQPLFIVDSESEHHESDFSTEQSWLCQNLQISRPPLSWGSKTSYQWSSIPWSVWHEEYLTMYKMDEAGPWISFQDDLCAVEFLSIQGNLVYRYYSRIRTLQMEHLYSTRLWGPAFSREVIETKCNGSCMLVGIMWTYNLLLGIDDVIRIW